MPEQILPVQSLRHYCRHSRITKAQRLAMQRYGSHYSLATHDSKTIDLSAAFPHSDKRIVDIGFGNGHDLIQLASLWPDCDFLGIEVSLSSIGSLLIQAHDQGLNNIRVLHQDARAALQRLPDASVARIHIFFPDPWPKRRQQKRRLVQADFIACLANKLTPHGILHIATDHEAYARNMLTALQACATLRNAGGANQFHTRPSYRTVSKYERRGLDLGHRIWDMVFHRNPDP